MEMVTTEDLTSMCKFPCDSARNRRQLRMITAHLVGIKHAIAISNPTLLFPLCACLHLIHRVLFLKSLLNISISKEIHIFIMLIFMYFWSTPVCQHSQVGASLTHDWSIYTWPTWSSSLIILNSRLYQVRLNLSLTFKKLINKGLLKISEFVYKG